MTERRHVPPVFGQPQPAEGGPGNLTVYHCEDGRTLLVFKPAYRTSISIELLPNDREWLLQALQTKETHG